MPSYWIRSGAAGAGTGADWTNAYVSVAAAETAGRNLSGNIYYIADDHTEPNVVANKTFVGPASGLPLIMISADHTDAGAIPAYLTGTTPQLSSLGGAYQLTLDGAFAQWGIRLAAGAASFSSPDLNESFYQANCTWVLPANGQWAFATLSQSAAVYRNLTLDLSADASSGRTVSPIGVSGNGALIEIVGLSFTTAIWRTGTVFAATNPCSLSVSGADFSGFTNTTLCELFATSSSSARAVVSDCITASTWAPFAAGTMNTDGSLFLTNVGPSNAPTYLATLTYYGGIISTTAIYRTGGASIGGTNTAWLITTTANCGEGAPFFTPWIYSNVASTGSKTFTIATVHDTAGGFSAAATDAEMWIEVEYLATSGSGKWTLATDQRSNSTNVSVSITEPPDTQASDSSTWVTPGQNLFTYSEQAQSSAWGTPVQSSVTHDTTAAPDLAASADLVTENTAVTTQHSLRGPMPTKAASAIEYTGSIYVKANGRTWVRVLLGNSGLAAFAATYVNLSTGALGGNAISGFTGGTYHTPTDAGNGWWRIAITATTDTSTTIAMTVAGATGDGGWSYTGDGTSGFYVWGAQLNTGSSAGTYVKTESQAMGPSFTNKQQLAVTATVNQTGQVRARVAVGKASITSAAYLYVDPKVTVS